MSDKKNYYYNRELSWMDFNARVLEEAQKKDNFSWSVSRPCHHWLQLDEFLHGAVGKARFLPKLHKADGSLGMTLKEPRRLIKNARLYGEAVFSPIPLSFCRSSQAEIEFARRKSSRTSKEPLRTSIFLSCCSRADAARCRQQLFACSDAQNKSLNLLCAFLRAKTR